MKKRILTVILLVVIFTSMGILASCTAKPLVGFDIDLARAVAEKLEIEVEFVEIDWNQKDYELRSKNIDCIWNGFTINEDRKKTTEFSQPYMLNKQVLVVQSENPQGIQTVEDIKNVNKIGVEAGSAGEAYLKSLGIDEGKKEAYTYQRDSLMGLSAGSISVAVIDAIMAGFYVNAETSSYKGKLKIIDVDSGEEHYGIGFRKNEPLLKYNIEKALYDLQEAGEIDEIAEKYGLKDELVKIEEPEKPEDTVADEGWQDIKNKGKIRVGVYFICTYCL